MTIRKQVILSLGSLSPVSSRTWTRLRNLQAHVDTPSLPILLEIQGMQVLGSLCFHYTFFKVDGSALFQSARIDGADFLNFDTRKGRDIHPRYFCGPRHLCQKMFQGCAIYARILKSKISKPPFPFSSPFALNFPFLLPPFPFSFPSPLSFLLSLSPPFPPPFPLPLQMERFGNL